jgi:GTPase SAR1 family protein
MSVRSKESASANSTDWIQGDVGGQKTLRSYWKNYFEKTDAVIWVVDAHDPIRMKECARELHTLLQHEVSPLEGILRVASTNGDV